MPMRASVKNLLLRPAPVPALSSSSTTAPAGVSNFKMDQMLVAADAFNKEDEEGDHITPVSIGSSVKSSSTGSGGSKPNEMRPLSPEEVTSMEISLKAVEYKRLCMNIEQMQQMATECGVHETDPNLWLGLLEIIHSERATKFFMDSNPVVRLAMIKHYAKIYTQRLDIKKTLLKRDEESADEELEEEYLNSFIDNNPGTSSRKVLAGRRPSKLSSSQGKQELSSKPSKSPKRTKTT